MYVVFSSGVCPSVAQFVQVSSDVNSECFQLENNFIICYHRAVISTRPTLITRPGTRERLFATKTSTRLHYTLSRPQS